MKKITKKYIFWIKVKLEIIKWIGKPFYYQEKGRVFCTRCGDFGWHEKGDLDIHDMIHWD